MHKEIINGHAAKDHTSKYCGVSRRVRTSKSRLTNQDPRYKKLETPRTKYKNVVDSCF